VSAILFGMLGGLLMGAVVVLVVLRRDARAWRRMTAAQERPREPQRLAAVDDGLPRVVADAERLRAAERLASQQRFVDRRVADLVRQGVPRAVAEHDADDLWAAIDLGPIG
jgi:hypothetical protein